MPLPIQIPRPNNDQIYLNTAAVGILPEATLEAQLHHARLLATTGEAHIPALLEIQEEARAGLGRLLGVETEDVGFMASTSAGMDLFAQIGLKSGRDRILCPGEEFPSSTLPWLGRDYALQFIKPREGGYYEEEFAAAMGSGADVFAIVVSAAQFSNGTRTPLKALADLAHRHGALLIANVTQATGLMPLSLLKDGVDFAAGTGHKWLMSGFGNGFIAAPKASRERFTLPGMGWLSVEDPMAMENRVALPMERAARVEYGTMGLLPRVCLAESIRTLEIEGMERNFAYVRGLSKALRAGAKERGISILGAEDPARQGATVLLKIDGSEALVEALAKKGIVVSHRRGGIRLSPHLYNTPGDITAFFEALDSLR